MHLEQSIIMQAYRKPTRWWDVLQKTGAGHVMTISKIIDFGLLPLVLLIHFAFEVQSVDVAAESESLCRPQVCAGFGRTMLRDTVVVSCGGRWWV